MNKKIDILLPVYNGGKYLTEQIESILKQTVTDWRLLIRNDGSKDNSQEIIDYYCNKFPDKIIAINDEIGNVGLLEGLNILLENVSDDCYVMFSDQDDVWLDNKIEISLKEIMSIEKEGMPAMICSDVMCVDEKLNIINESFFNSQKFSKNVMNDYNRMAALNIVQGCTVMINGATLKYIFPIPNFLKVHDAWIALICKQIGNVKYIETPTMLYRQHGNNVLGELTIDRYYYLSRLRNVFTTLKLLFNLSKRLPYRLNIIKVIYYKFFYAFKRCKK